MYLAQQKLLHTGVSQDVYVSFQIFRITTKKALKPYPDIKITNGVIAFQADEFIRISLLCFSVQCYQTVSNVDVNCAVISV